MTGKYCFYRHRSRRTVLLSLSEKFPQNLTEYLDSFLHIVELNGEENQLVAIAHLKCVIPQRY